MKQAHSRPMVCTSSYFCFLVFVVKAELLFMDKDRLI